MWASQYGRTETIKLMLAVSDIDVNYAKVGTNPALALTLAMMTYHPPTHNMYFNPKKISRVWYFSFCYHRLYTFISPG